MIIKPVSLFGLLVIFLLLGVNPGQAQANGPAKQSNPPEAPLVTVDKVVAHPKRFKGTISVVGRVGSGSATNSLFALTCEDACVSMPVKFSGTPPHAGREVVVRGQISKDAKGRYLFDAESVRLNK